MLKNKQINIELVREKEIFLVLQKILKDAHEVFMEKF